MKQIERERVRRKPAGKPLAPLVLAVSALLSAQTVSAADGDITQTWTLTSPGSTPPTATTTSTVFGQANMPAWGYPNLPIPSNGATIDLNTAGVSGRYRVNANYWNQDITWGNVTTTTQTLTVNDQTGAYTVKPSTSNSYYPGSRPQDNLPCAAGAFNSQDPCHWAANRVDPSAGPIHAPANYPSIYNGCHYNQCTQNGTWKDGTTKVGAPYPLQVNQITSIPSHWIVDTSTVKSTAVFDVAYDIWFDKNPNRIQSGTGLGNIDPSGTPSLPGSPQNVNQNNGLEIMIWINNRGYTQGGTVNGGIIQPSGNLVASAVPIEGVTGTWDVWVTNTRKSGTAPNDWYVVSYVKVPDGATAGATGGGTDDFQFDSKWFINDAAKRDCIGEKCLQPTWWLTSAQAGFEIWADGDGLATRSFTAEPTWKATTVQGGNKWKDENGNDILDENGNSVPIIYWGQSYQVTASCPNPDPGDTATWTLTGQDPSTTPPTPVNLSGTLLPDVTGVLTGSVPAMQPAHEWAQINVTTSCVNGGGGAQPPINVWIDPAGTVKDTLGNPLVGAKVVLYKLNTDTNVFEVVPNGSGIMSDKNRKNPDATGLYGDFSWDVLPGRYKVRASYPGCHAVGKPTQPYVDSAAYDIPPPALGIKLVLQCAAPGGGTTPGVTVKLTDNGDQRWQRYCKNVVVTNTNNFPVDWKVKFDLPYPGYIDPVPSGHWNFNYTAAGKTITAWGVDWNKTLAPKATSHSIGFCAFKN